MRRLLVLISFVLCCLPAWSAVPSYQAFKGTNGIIVRTNPPTGDVIIDGAGVSGGPGTANGITNVSDAANVGISLIYTSNNFTIKLVTLSPGSGIWITNNGTNLVIAGTGTNGLATITYVDTSVNGASNVLQTMLNNSYVWTNQLGEVFLLGDTNLIRISSNNASLTIGRHASEGGVSANFSINSVKSVAFGDNPENGFNVSSIVNNSYDYFSEFYADVKADPVAPFAYFVLDSQAQGALPSSIRMVATPGSEEISLTTSGLQEFHVNAGGHLETIAGLPGYVWPFAHASGFLQNDGVGGLSWAAASGGDSVWTNDLGIVHLNTITNRIAIGTNGIPDGSLLYIAYQVTNPPTYLYHIEDYVSGNTYLTAAWGHSLENGGSGYTKDYSAVGVWENFLPPNGGMDAMYSNLGAFGGYFATGFVDPLNARTNGEAVGLFGDTRGYYSSQFGVVGAAQGRVGVTQTNVGLAGISIKQTGNTSVGGYFEIHNTGVGTPRFDESVLLLDNRAQGTPLLIARSNTVQAFKVDAKGDITLIKQLAYVWPTAHVTGGTLLNDGSGGLSWSTDPTNTLAVNARSELNSASNSLVSQIIAATNNVGLEVGKPINTNTIYATLHTTGSTSGQTNDIYTFVPRTNSTVRVFVDVSAHNSTNSASYGKIATFKSTSPAVAQIGAAATVGSAEDLGVDECLIVLSNSTVCVRVAGSSNATMDWSAYVRLFYAP